MGNAESSLFKQTGGMPWEIHTGDFTEGTKSVEEKHTWEIRGMNPQDLEGVVNLFRSYYRPVETPNGIEIDSLHVYHEDLTLFVPSNWRNKDQVAMFQELAGKFYFPENPFPVKSPKIEEEVMVNRKSWIAVRDREIVGVISALTDDPYAPSTDRERAADSEKPLRMAYSHVMLVRTDARRSGVGSCLFAKLNDAAFIAGYDQVTALVDRAGAWSANVDFLTSIGFDPDRRKKTEYHYLSGDGEIVYGQRFILTDDNWKRNRGKVYSGIGKRWNIDAENIMSI